MHAMARLHARLRSALRRFRRAESGAAAVEFAFVIFPFCLLLFGIIELGMVFLASTTLDHATERAARQIRTGEFQTAGDVTPAAFKGLVCGHMSWLESDCASNLYVDVRIALTFNDVEPESPVEDGGFDPAETCFEAGGPTDIVLVRTYYQWPLFTPLLDRSLENMTGTGKRLITSAAVFRNEPFGDAAPGASAC
jgi:Flp pilus assembly protein TadG